MRDVNRLNELYKKLEECHRQYPDLRFGQMITLLMSNIERDGGDFFYMEDDKMLKAFDKYLTNM